MQMTYETFKLILGLIASVFILSFFIYYSGTYARIEQDLQKSLAVKNFIKTLEDVYISGNSITFSDFERINADLFFEPSGRRAEFGFRGAMMPVPVPLFFARGMENEFYIYRNSFDYGWWKFYYILALPEMNIVFDVREDNPVSKSIVSSIVSVFPSTYYTQPKIRFGFCDSQELYDQYDFLSLLYYYSGGSECNRQSDGKTKIVTISSDCTNVFSGVCISAYDENVGYAFADNETYIYKDGLDLAALILGSGYTNIYGKLCKQIFDYKNRVFWNEIVFASRIMGTRALGIAQNINPSYSVGENCRPLYATLAEKLRDIEKIPENYYEISPTTIIVVKDVQRFLDESRSAYESLTNMGCELP